MKKWMLIISMVFSFGLMAIGTANAAIVVTEVSGVSNSILPNGDNIAHLSLFGGMAGPQCGQPQMDTTCDSCNMVDGLQKCNRKRIHGDLPIRIHFQSDTTEGRAVIEDHLGMTLFDGEYGQVGQSLMIEMTWRSLCQAMSVPGVNCDTLDTSFMANLRLGIRSQGEPMASEFILLRIVAYNGGERGEGDINLGCDSIEVANAGVCDFGFIPGNEEVRLSPVMVNPGFPNMGPVYFTNVLLNLSETHFPCSANEGNVHSMPIVVKEDGNMILENPIIENLVNHKSYYARVSTQDVTGNIGNFMADSVIRNQCGSKFSCDEGKVDLTGLSPDCSFVARPGGIE